jgi:glycosyltransferase involved in cell wall biosynthesis
MSVFCSTIIPTINRSTLSRAVCSILDQSFRGADFEVIVVNDSGQLLPFMHWQYSDRVKVIDTNCRERSVARNTGAAVAKGKYLHFLDDDDRLLPGALDAFWSLDQGGDAAWLHGSYQTVDNDGNLIEEIHPEIIGNGFALMVAGESIPLQASLLQANLFHEVGVFDPSPSLTGVEDRDLGRRMAMSGVIAHTPAIVARIRIGERGSTTDWTCLAEKDRLGREKILNTHNGFYLLNKSANSCSWHGRIKPAYWHGRVSRAYFASMVWNLQQRKLLTATSRGLACLAFAGKYTFAADFWLGLRKNFIPFSASQEKVGLTATGKQIPG